MTSRSGGLLELVARGKKDQFFTANPSVSFFHSLYTRAAPFTKEIYVSTPRNAPEWGKWVDFDIEHRGDFVKHFYLRIQLPTWLPPEVAAINPTGIVTDASGVSFGWCNNVGFQMLDKIQIFQDQLLIHEAYGEYLEWRLRQSYGYTTTYLVGAEVGGRPETPLGIGRSATFTELRVPFPVFGWQYLNDPGLPLCGLRKQRFRIRIHLRKLEDLVVASDGRIAPQPWGGKPLLVQATRDGLPLTDYVTLDKYPAMTRLTMNLEQTVLYVPKDVQQWINASTFRFPFQTVQYQQFTLEDNLMTAASQNPGAVFQYPLNIDFIGSVDRLLLGFRSAAATEAGQRTYLRASNGSPFIRSVRLNIANIDRIKQWQLPVVREVTAYWKSQRMALDLSNSEIPQEIYTLTFGGFDSAAPAGTLNFTRASLPVLYVVLNAVPYDVRNISRKTYALLYAESWNVFEVCNGVGKMMFDDS
jgi:hypothetical protein